MFKDVETFLYNSPRNSAANICMMSSGIFMWGYIGAIVALTIPGYSTTDGGCRLALYLLTCLFSGLLFAYVFQLRMEFTVRARFVQVGNESKANPTISAVDATTGAK